MASGSAETKQANSTLNGNHVPGSSIEKPKVGAEEVPNRQTEDGVVKSNLKDIPETTEQAKLEIDHEVVPESTELNPSPHKLQHPPVNDSESCDNNHRMSGGRKTSTSKKSTKRKSSVGSSSPSTRVLRSRSQAKSDAPQPTETGTVQTNCPDPEQSGLPSEDLIKKIVLEQLRSAAAEDKKNSTPELEGPTEEAEPCKSLDSPQTPHNSSTRQQGSQPEEAANITKSSGVGGRKSSKTSAKGKKEPTTSAENARVLRSRSQEKSKATDPSSNAEVHAGANGEQRRKRKKKKQQNKNHVDEYLRTRKHLKYLLHRMAYEQNLIDAYGEGWKGQSLEKLKPEKELERAKSEILSCKLRIRNLFQRLDSSIEEGRFSEALYDSDGLLDSEDIYCAKCGSKDVLENNDIILCDGACERGFHQFCLEPPLLKEQIPSDEEGWLCPGCDCKVDCIELLNDAQGTDLSILKTWEKVFPEAAAAAAGNKLDENNELPSDDSDDNDYDPDCSDADDKAQEDESSSDESESYSASEESNPVKNEHNSQLSSDDSEDDDYDPDAPDLDEQVKQEHSSSDFSSDSEDFSIAFDSLPKDEQISASLDHMGTGISDGGGTLKLGSQKKKSLDEEPLSLSKSGPDVSESEPVSQRRHVERLDYKKLYDDEYGNDSTDSSDDEWFDAEDAPRKRIKSNTKEDGSGSCDPSTQVTKKTDDNGVEHETATKTPKKRSRKKAGTEGTHSSPAKGTHSSPAKEGSSEPSSANKKSQFKRLGEAATQGLLMSFKENQYPDKTKKENLAKELGITAAQVSKWFENARWSFRHTSRMNASLAQCTPPKGTPSKPSPQDVAQCTPTKGTPTKPGPQDVAQCTPTKGTPTKPGPQDVAQCTPTKPGPQDVVPNGEQTNSNAGATMNEEPLTGESSKKKSSSSTLNSRKRRSQGGQQATEPSNEETEQKSVPTSGRRKTRKTAS